MQDRLAVARPAVVVTSALLLASALAPLGCAFHPPGAPPIDRDPLPVNSTPQGAIPRLERTYERQDEIEYPKLLTADFRYTFSAQSDPALATQYGLNWGKDDETQSAEHLFAGFVNGTGEAVPPASRITVDFVNDQYYPDPAHADSATWYVYCPVTNVNLTIDIPANGGTTTYDISAPHSFFLVRGDAALLDPGQAADSTRWYVRRWDDHSPALPNGGAAPVPLAAASWGGMKGSYDR